MMMPTRPGPNLVVGQSGFALAALQTLFDPVLRFRHAGELRQWRVGRSVGQVVVHFQHLMVVAIAVTNHDQHFLVAFLTPRGAHHHAAFEHLHEQRPLRTIAYVNVCPCIIYQYGSPSVDALPRSLGAPTTAAIGRRLHFQIANQRVRGNRQQIALVQRVEPSRNQNTRPNSSSPAIHACGRKSPFSCSISKHSW